MRLFDEILARIGADEDIAFGGAKAVVYAGRCAYFENVKGIAAFSSSAVTLRVRAGEVRVEGEGLCVARYDGGDLLLRGDVRRIEFGGVEG
mgnify:FL=1